MAIVLLLLFMGYRFYVCDILAIVSECRLECHIQMRLSHSGLVLFPRFFLSFLIDLFTEEFANVRFCS